jgi:hypothetical protein
MTELLDLFAFVRSRMGEDLAAADRNGEVVAAKFTRWCLVELDHLERDLRSGHRPSSEVETYLRRMAVAYDEHPDFREEWRRQA